MGPGGSKHGRDGGWDSGRRDSISLPLPCLLGGRCRDIGGDGLALAAAHNDEIMMSAGREHFAYVFHADRLAVDADDHVVPLEALLRGG